MKTVVLEPPPCEVEQLIERRKALGLDRYDEMWEGVYHMVPMGRFRHGRLQARVLELIAGPAEQAGLLLSGPFNLGAPEDFRVPDAGLHQGQPDDEAVYLETAAVVIEIVSPDDETYDKLPFYAAHGVEELIVVDAELRRVRIFTLAGRTYEERSTSPLLSASAAELTAQLDWR